MKNFFKILFPALLLLLSACQREMELTEAGRMAEGPVSVAVTIDPETRTTVSETTGAISFSCGDAIKIYNGTGTYTGITQDASTAAQFSMEKGFSASGSGFAGFPADLVSGITSSGVSFTLPDTYGFARVGGEEANKADVPCPMVGNYAGGGISLKPACALVRFYLTGIKAGTIVFTFPTNVTGSTTAIATPTGTNDGITSLSNGGKTVTVTDVPDAPKGRYVYITLPVPTGTKPQNIKVVNSAADGSTTLMAAVTGSSASLARAAGHKVMNISFVSPEAVDLGIGVKWASFNVGALSETEYGDYFAWGETAPKTLYSWSTYKWGTSSNLTKYANDGRPVLEPSDDAATVNWGGKWRMPTREDFLALRDKTDMEWVTNYNGTGVNGCKYMNKQDHSKYIFIPAGGGMEDTSVVSSSYGYYWSSSLDYLSYATYYRFSSTPSAAFIDRYYGFSVRPVLQEEAPLASLTLSAESVTLVTGGTQWMKVKAFDACGNLIPEAQAYWAVVSGKSATVNARGCVTAGTQPGPTVLRATVSYGGVTKTADCTVIVQAEGLEMVDMGLSVKWANMNVGATAVTGKGGYFGWGETETKPFNTPYHWTRYQWCEGALSTLTKYCNSSDYGYYGFTDTKTVLELSDDAARVYMGGDWRMPTKAEFEELLALTNNEWVTNYNGSGVAGRLFTANNGKTLFLPAEGYMDGAVDYNTDKGYYWSSTLNTDNANRAWNVYLSTGGSGYGYRTSYENRCYGMQVRAVSK